MAYYGIPSAGLAVTAGTTNDKVSVANLGGTFITAQSVYGGDGNDIISLGAVGHTATATWSGKLVNVGSGGTKTLTGGVQLVGSATYQNTGTVTMLSGVVGGTTGLTVAVTGVITSHQAIRTAVGAIFQANAGNDSIALGGNLTTVSAVTFAGGAGNDIIGGFTNVNDVWSTAGVAGTITKTEFQGGLGADTIELSGAATYSALFVNGNQGDDVVSLEGDVAVLTNSTIGAGAGNDTVSGQFVKFTASTLAGGKGNDTIQLNITSAENVIIGGDRANPNPLAGDGNDSIYVESATSFSATTIYGGGGNDTVTFSASLTASTVSMGAGRDAFTAGSGSQISDTTIGLGSDNDIFMHLSGKTLSSRINAGKGADSVYFVDTDVASGAFVGSTTVYGGAGADYLIGSANNISAGGTVAVEIEYLNNSESTLSAFDTIAVNATDDQNATYSFRYEVGGATQANFSAAKATTTNGAVTFTAGFDNNLTARVDYIAANTSVGNAATFLDIDSKAYLFVKGSSDNLVVQIGSAAVSGVSTVNVNASKNIDVTILG